MRIHGTTELVAHIGFHERLQVAAHLQPVGHRDDRAPDVGQREHGDERTRTGKVAAAALVDEASTAVRIAGSCNAVRRMPDGRLHGDLFDGDGFVRAAPAASAARSRRPLRARG